MKKLLFILPLSYHANLPHFRSRFEVLSREIESHILLTGDPSLDGDKFKGGVLHVQQLPKKYTSLGKLKQAFTMIKMGLAIARKERIDFAIAYDPLKLGLVGSIIKLFSGCRLIVEVNGHYKNANAKVLENGEKNLIRKILYNTGCYLTLAFADAAKLLNFHQFTEWRAILRHKPCFIFHDFVPIQLFTPSGEDGDYILCAGFPFRIKGVDVLLEAFTKICDEFSGVRLIIMGHCREPELSWWRAKIEMVPGAELRRPVPYDEMPEMLRKCLILALPSRSEAMGRVLIEAMACGKAVVGSRVGGIPNLIKDGVNGLLAEPDDVNDLADKLKRILRDKEMRAQMGEQGFNYTRTTLSEESYVNSFLSMLESVEVNGKSKKRKGIVYSVYDNNMQP